MPHTATQTAPAPAALPRLPLTGREDAAAILRFIAVALGEADDAPAGSLRFAPEAPPWEGAHAPLAFRHAESGLRFRVERTGSGLNPYMITCSAQAQTVPHAPPADEPRNLSVKVYANGEARWPRIVAAARTYAARKVEAEVYLAAQRARQDAAWASLREYMDRALASGVVPTPERAGSLDPSVSGYRCREWDWRFTARENVDAAVDVALHAVISLCGPVQHEEVSADFDPAMWEVSVGIGLGSRAADTNMSTHTLADALAIVKGLTYAREHLAAVLTVREESVQGPVPGWPVVDRSPRP